MTDLKARLQIALQDAGYNTWLGAIDELDVVGFEDEAVMGFTCIFKDAVTMLSRWRDVETRLLAGHASLLQRGGEKTWNVYKVFLSQAVPDEIQSREIRWIEEDLERTRKLAACGISDQQTLITALLPLLPLQTQPELDRDDFDVTQRLTRRIANIAPSVATVALDPGVSASEVVRLLGVDI
jgi:hypothetical protein